MSSFRLPGGKEEISMWDQVIMERFRKRMHEVVGEIIKDAQERFDKEVSENMDDLIRTFLGEVKMNHSLYAHLENLETKIFIKAYYNDEELKDE